MVKNPSNNHVANIFGNTRPYLINPQETSGYTLQTVAPPVSEIKHFEIRVYF